ncbi:MAG: DUF6442 family protein [Clostridia bacterium]|nr:DUF6442 family protein [Clostridia bacterium]
MNKEDILAKAKKENIYGDEREKKIRVHRDAFSCWGTIILGIIIMAIKLVRVESPADIIALFFCGAATASLYEAIQTRKKVHIIVTIVLFVLTIYYFYKFCTGIF